MRLTFIEWWKRLWGKEYVVNHNKKEIHRLWHKHTNCLLAVMTNKEYVNKHEADVLIEKGGYNGCRWCWKEKDNG